MAGPGARRGPGPGSAREERFAAELAGTPVELVIGPARARITAHFAPLRAAARSAVLEVLDSARYFTILDDLDRLLADPPVTAAAEPADEVLAAAIARAYRRTNRRMSRAARAPEGAARDVALREARKAAKRARYAADAADAAEPAFGQRARRFGLLNERAHRDALEYQEQARSAWKRAARRLRPAGRRADRLAVLSLRWLSGAG